jgi:signal transduction histidine kinase
MAASSDPLVRLEQAFAQTQTALQQVPGPADRALRLASVLCALWPAAPAAACRLLSQGQAHDAVVTKEGFDASPGPYVRPASAPFPPDLPGELRWLDTGVVGTGPAHGAVAVALAVRTSEKAETSLRRLLSAYARELALQLDEEAGRQERKVVGQTLAEQTWSATLGSLASPITHEFNNFLNVVLLQVAVLEQELPLKQRGEFAVIRQQGKNVAELVRQWQQYRYRQQPALYPVDLNPLVREVVQGLAAEPPAFGESRLALAPSATADVLVHLELEDGLPAVSGTTGDLRRLVRFLVSNAAAAITTLPGQVTVRSKADGGKVRLVVEDSGPAVDADLLPQLFEPLVMVREGLNRLELATCKTLVHRRLQGNIQAENRTGGGLAVVVLLRPA